MTAATYPRLQRERDDVVIPRLSRVAELPAFERTLFSGCWEDTETEVDALRLGPGSRVLSITASGGRSLNILRSNPSQVISVDLNPAQSALLELKRASLAAFDRYEEHASFLGVLQATPERREQLFKRVAPLLPREARNYWMQRSGDVRRGVLHCGRQDQLMRWLRMTLRSVLDTKKLERIFEMDDLDEQIDFWNRHYDRPAFRALIRMAGSKRVLWWIYRQDLYETAGRFGPGEMALEGFRRHVNARLLRENYFLQQVLLGRYLDPRGCNSYYLEERNFEDAKKRQENVHVVTAPLEDVLASLPDDSLDGFSYSDIFDWIEVQDFQKLMKETVRVARDGARICYRICLVGRYPDDSLSPWIQPDHGEKDRLLGLDRSCFYRDLYVGTIHKGTVAS